ncbi:MAG: RHS repeat domain-containing protein [Stenotrophomonas sp.]
MQLLKAFLCFAFCAALQLLSSSAHAQTTVEYIHTDALGSPVAVTDASGNIVEREVYEPYGSPITRPPSDQPGFTGHVADSLTGLTYMQQRYYDPQIGRFLSVDAVKAHSNPLGAFNRYWYANNNPYKFTDPDGREIKLTFFGGVSEQSGRAYMAAMSLSPTARELIMQLAMSEKSYEIRLNGSYTAGSQFVQSKTGGVIHINPTVGLRIASTGEIQSPRSLGAHEISHAAQYDKLGSEEFNKAMIKPRLADGTFGIEPEEARATKAEQQVAKELQEPSRRSYDDWKPEDIRCSIDGIQGC